MTFVSNNSNNNHNHDQKHHQHHQQQQQQQQLTLDLKMTFEVRDNNRNLSVVKKVKHICDLFTNDLKRIDLILACFIILGHTYGFSEGLETPEIIKYLKDNEAFDLYQSESYIINLLNILGDDSTGILKKTSGGYFEITSFGQQFYTRDLYHPNTTVIDF